MSRCQGRLPGLGAWCVTASAGLCTLVVVAGLAAPRAAAAPKTTVAGEVLSGQVPIASVPVALYRTRGIGEPDMLGRR